MGSFYTDLEHEDVASAPNCNERQKQTENKRERGGEWNERAAKKNSNNDELIEYKMLRARQES